MTRGNHYNHLRLKLGDGRKSKIKTRNRGKSSGEGGLIRATRNTHYFAAIAVFLLCCFSHAARHQEIVVSWDELSPIVEGKHTMIATLSGVLIEGEILSVGADHLSMEINKSSEKSRIAKGVQEIPRSQISVIQLKSVDGNGRLIGAIAGTGGGIVAGWAVAEGIFHTSGEGEGVLREPEGAASIVGIGAGAGLAGYLIGRGADTTITYIKIRP